MEPLIRLEQVKKEYPGITPLQNITVDIHKGDVISVIGPSGTGKSTLLRCVNMLDPPTSGKIFVEGKEITAPKANLQAMRQKMGMVFQNFNLFSHKMVIENVMMGPMDLLGLSKQEAFDRGVRLLKTVGLGEKLYAYPNELSGGQKQRVAIARCLAMDPEIILFDEPTSALDPTMVGEVQAVIRDLAAKGLTMMIVTHDMQFSKEIANRVFYMDEGVIYEDGPPEQIFENPQKERTRAFVKRLRMLEYQIRSIDFDLYAMNGKIQTFAKNNMINAKQLRNLELLLEEMILHNLITKTQDIEIGILYYEVDQCIEVQLNYTGAAYNPMEADAALEDDLSFLLVKRLVQEFQYYYHNKNHLTLKMHNQIN